MHRRAAVALFSLGCFWADAAVKAFQASVEVYKLNLSFTKATAPVDGQVSRYSSST